MTARDPKRSLAICHPYFDDILHFRARTLVRQRSEEIMRKMIVASIIIILSFASSESADNSIDVSEPEESILRTSFREPLQRELLRKGLSPRNAAIATQNIMDKLVNCWKSDRNTVTSQEQQTIVVRLGGRAIVTYPSPCIDDLLATVSEIPG